MDNKQLTLDLGMVSLDGSAEGGQVDMIPMIRAAIIRLRAKDKKKGLLRALSDRKCSECGVLIELCQC